MSHVTYKIVRHDGGWAYTAEGIFSEPYPTHEGALAAARAAAEEQRVPGRTEVIEWEDANGKWHTETASGADRPETDVKDGADSPRGCHRRNVRRPREPLAQALHFARVCLSPK